MKTTWQERVFERLVGLYPEPFRRRYGREMRQDFHALQHDGKTSVGFFAAELLAVAKTRLESMKHAIEMKSSVSVQHVANGVWVVLRPFFWAAVVAFAVTPVWSALSWLATHRQDSVLPAALQVVDSVVPLALLAIAIYLCVRHAGGKLGRRLTLAGFVTLTGMAGLLLVMTPVGKFIASQAPTVIPASTTIQQVLDAYTWRTHAYEWIVSIIYTVVFTWIVRWVIRVPRRHIPAVA